MLNAKFKVEAGTRPAPAVPELLAEIAATRAVANYQRRGFCNTV